MAWFLRRVVLSIRRAQRRDGVGVDAAWGADDVDQLLRGPVSAARRGRRDCVLRRGHEIRHKRGFGLCGSSAHRARSDQCRYLQCSTREHQTTSHRSDKFYTDGFGEFGEDDWTKLGEQKLVLCSPGCSTAVAGRNYLSDACRLRPDARQAAERPTAAVHGMRTLEALPAIAAIIGAANAMAPTKIRSATPKYAPMPAMLTSTIPGTWAHDTMSRRVVEDILDKVRSRRPVV